MYFTSRHFRTTLILYSYLCPRLPRALFPSGVHTKSLTAFYYLIYTTHSAHCVLLDMIALRIFSEQYHIACSSSLCSIPQALIASIQFTRHSVFKYSLFMSPQSFKCKTGVVKWNWRKLHNNKFQFIPSSSYRMTLLNFMYTATAPRRRYHAQLSNATSWVEHANTSRCLFQSRQQPPDGRHSRNIEHTEVRVLSDTPQMAGNTSTGGSILREYSLLQNSTDAAKVYNSALITISIFLPITCQHSERK